MQRAHRKRMTKTHLIVWHAHSFIPNHWSSQRAAQSSQQQWPFKVLIYRMRSIKLYSRPLLAQFYARLSVWIFIVQCAIIIIIETILYAYNQSATVVCRMCNKYRDMITLAELADEMHADVGRKTHHWRNRLRTLSLSCLTLNRLAIFINRHLHVSECFLSTLKRGIHGLIAIRLILI